MLLLVARCLAVYGATAAAILLLVRRFVSPLSLRVALVLAAAPLLFTGRALLTGAVYGPIDILYNGYPFGAHRVELGVSPDRTPVLSDVVYQQIPWRAAFRRAVSEGRLPLWNPDVLAGEPLLAVQQPAVLHPGTWIGLLLPLPQAWTFDMTLRLLIALLCAYLFLRDLWCGELAALLGALGWAFSNWMVFSLGVPLMAAAAPFPLLLLGLRRIVREPGRRSVALTVVALVLIGVAGHPETLLHVCAAGGVYLLFEAFAGSDPRRGSDPRSPGAVRPLLRSLTLALCAGALALGLLAVQLLPLAEALPHTLEHPLRKFWYASQPRALPPGQSLSRLTPQVMPYAVGVSGQGRLMEGFIEPSAYGGALLFPLAFAGLFARSRERWIFVALGLLGLAVAVKTPAADALAKLPLFDIALNERLVFLTVFSLCVLAALGAQRLRDGEGAPALFAGAGATLVLLGVLFTRVKPRVLALGMPPAALTERLLLQIVPLLLAAAVLAFLSRRRRATAGLAAVILIFAASRRLEVGATHPVMPPSTFYPPMRVLERIPRDEPWRIAGVGERALIPNASAVYGLEDVRGYAAMTLLRFSETFPLWCEAQPVWFNRIDDPTRPFLSFLNVRWVLTEPSAAVPPGWPVLAEADGLRLLENPGALPRVFVPRTVRVEKDPARRRELLKSIDDFSARGLVESDGPSGEWTENGPARLEIAAYRSDALDVDVEASAETLVGTSLTAWPGWRARLDGAAIPALAYNHAFLAFRVPPGRHRLSLRYFPEGVARGLAVSGATLLLCAFLLFRPGRSELRQNPV